MNTITQYFTETANLTQPHLHLIDVEHYHRMGEMGILEVNARTELIEGKIIDRVPIGSKHADRVNRLARFFFKTMPNDILISIQNPVRLNQHTEPEPDIALLKPRQQPYSEAHPRPEDVLLIIEVSDATLTYDRRVKLLLYAQHGITEVWIIDVAANCIDIYRQPQ